MVEEDVGAYLQAEGVGTVGVDLFYHQRPDQPDAVTVVRRYGGLAPTRTHDGATYERPRIQVSCRAPAEPASYATAVAQAERCASALMRLTNRVIAGTRYLSATALGPVIPLGRDDDGRETVAVNVEIDKERR